jgi:acetyl-CoA carboxylase biotin carboxyl carrier protein
VPTHAIVAPLVGTCYLASAPGAPPFVEVGDVVEVGQQVAIIEAMKLMNAVVADRAGRVVEIVARDATAVEYEAPLVLLRSAELS